MNRRELVALGLATILMLGIQSVAHANKCKAGKVKGLGSFAACVARAEARAAAVGIDPLSDLKTTAAVTKCQQKLLALYARLDLKGGCETSGDGAAVSGGFLLWRLVNFAQLCVMRDENLLATCIAPTGITVTATCARGCNGGVNQGLACIEDAECPGAACVSAFPALVTAGICAP